MKQDNNIVDTADSTRFLGTSDSWTVKITPLLASIEEDKPLIQVAGVHEEDTRSFASTDDESSDEEESCEFRQEHRLMGVSHQSELQLPPPPAIHTAATHQSTNGPPKSCLKKETAVRPKDTVRFGTITIRRYEITLGDHPCVTKGVPLTLDWDYTEQPTLPLEEYEEMLPSAAISKLAKLRRMHLTKQQRQQLLVDRGFDIEAIQKAKKHIQTAKRHRQRSHFWAPAELLLHKFSKKTEQ